MTDDTAKPSPTPTVTTTTAVAAGIPDAGLGRHACTMKCPYCKKQMETRTEVKTGMMTIVGIFALFIFFFPLFWLPLCLPACKDTDHFCKECNRRVGTVAACS